MLDNRENRQGAKLLSAILMIFCLTLLILTAPQVVWAKEHRLGDIPLHPEKYKKHLKVWPMEMAEMLPASYDARDYNIVTPAKDQGSCGSCWAFASVGAMESHMMKAYQAGTEDLSEQQQVSCNISMAGCSGGSSTAILYWETKGPLQEECFTYTASDTTPCGEYPCEQLGYRVIDWHTVGTSDFKNSLYTYGPSYWRFDVYSDFDTYWATGAPGQVYTSQRYNSYRGGHAVLLIGWDDSKGAYLCKNSWGGGGPNGDGTFWIAYSGHYYNLHFGMANFSLTALTCSSDKECDDGVYCNGSETCVEGACQDGTPIECPDDGLFCNGSEVCDEANQGCGSTGNPCESGFECNEVENQCVSLCGNGVCDAGEDCNSCSDDCISGPAGGTPEACWKYDGICHPTKEDASCSDCAPSYCCGDGVCNGKENSDNCELDCGSSPGTEVCNDGLDNDGDGNIDCADSDCTGDPACSSCTQKGDPCSSGEDCCSGQCHPVKGVCK